MTSNSVIVRPYDPSSDRSFILATWLRGLYYGDSWFSSIPKDIFMENYHKILEARLSQPLDIRIACLSDTPDVILGYAVLRGDKIDWIYVKSAWRKIGIAKALLGGSNLTTCTHLTKLGKRLKPDSMIFNPFV